jgi:hypothetical protein
LLGFVFVDFFKFGARGDAHGCSSEWVRWSDGLDALRVVRLKSRSPSGMTNKKDDKQKG